MLFNKPTLELKTGALSRRRVWHTHTNFTPYDACNKRTKSSMIEPTCNGEKVTKSLLPSWKMTMSVPKDETTGRSNCSVFATVLPPTPCQRVTIDSARRKLTLKSLEWEDMDSRKRQMKECPKINTQEIEVAMCQTNSRKNAKTLKGKRFNLPWKYLDELRLNSRYQCQHEGSEGRKGTTQ